MERLWASFPESLWVLSKKNAEHSNIFQNQQQQVQQHPTIDIERIAQNKYREIRANSFERLLFQIWRVFHVSIVIIPRIHYSKYILMKKKSSPNSFPQKPILFSIKLQYCCSIQCFSKKLLLWFCIYSSIRIRAN